MRLKMKKIKKVKNFLTYNETDNILDFSFRIGILISGTWIITVVLATIGNCLANFPACIPILRIIVMVTSFLAFVNIALLLWLIISLLKGNGIE